MTDHFSLIERLSGRDDFEVPKNKQALSMKLFVTRGCIWSDSGALRYIQYINGVISTELCPTIELQKRPQELQKSYSKSKFWSVTSPRQEVHIKTSYFVKIESWYWILLLSLEMLFIFAFSDPTIDKCVVEIDMAGLRVCNSALYQWISNVTTIDRPSLGDRSEDV